MKMNAKEHAMKSIEQAYQEKTGKNGKQAAFVAAYILAKAVNDFEAIEHFKKRIKDME